MFEFLGVAGIALSMLAYLPQVVHLAREHCSAGVSRRAWAMWLVSSLLVGTLAVHRGDLVFILLQISSLTSAAVILMLAQRYRGMVCEAHALRGPFGVEMAGEVLLPGPDAQIAPTTFETRLAAQAVGSGQEPVQTAVDGDCTPLPTLREPAGDAATTGVDVDANGPGLRSDGAGCRLAVQEEGVVGRPLEPTGIYSVAVQVRHLDRSLAFYRDLLGLRLQYQEGQMAQLHGYGDTAASLVLFEVGGYATRLGGGTGLVRVAWRVDKQADLDVAEQLLQREGLTYQRRRQEGLDIVDTRDPDRTHVLLVWLSHDVVADDRLPPQLYGWE